MSERSWTFHDAIRLVLLFHDGTPWGPAKRAEWRRITDTEEVTSKVLCDHLRSLLDGGGAFAPGLQAAFGDRCLKLTAGHVLTEKDVADIRALLWGNREDEGEAATAEQRGYLRAIQEFGGEELADAVAARDESEITRMAERAMKRVRLLLARSRAKLD